MATSLPENAFSAVVGALRAARADPVVLEQKCWVAYEFAREARHFAAQVERPLRVADVFEAAGDEDVVALHGAVLAQEPDHVLVVERVGAWTDRGLCAEAAAAAELDEVAFQLPDDAQRRFRRDPVLCELVALQLRPHGHAERPDAAADTVQEAR